MPVATAPEPSPEPEDTPVPVLGPPWFARKVLSDQRELTVWPLARGGGAVLFVGEPAAREYDDAWEFGCHAAAVAALHVWDPRDDAEPPGWVRHPRTGRVRRFRRRPGA